MGETPTRKPGRGGKAGAAERRTERLAAALRANLKRRKRDRPDGQPGAKDKDSAARGPDRQ